MEGEEEWCEEWCAQDWVVQTLKEWEVSTKQTPPVDAVIIWAAKAEGFGVSGAGCGAGKKKKMVKREWNSGWRR